MKVRNAQGGDKTALIHLKVLMCGFEVVGNGQKERSVFAVSSFDFSDFTLSRQLRIML